MMRSLYTASSGMYAQQLNIDTLSHNMANVNTVGFKKQRLEFQDLLYQTIRRPAADEDRNEPVGLLVGLGVKPAAINTIFNTGSLQATENPLDVAINGTAFFGVKVEGNDELLYTRDGAFKIDANGQLVTADGNLLEGADTFDEGADDIQIAIDGKISYMKPGQDKPEDAGQLKLFKFINPAGLHKVGKNLYRATPNSGEAEEWQPDSDKSVSLEASYLEMSNVQIVEEMVNLITAQRAYEINSKVIISSDEMLQTAANLRR
ncbi:MAG: flagellar basal-body rod protein FlgG [Syntrophomonas sp.]|uniref:flagellar basal-body rod protein FlgG n=1 Tax=Syntrophomonas sp. TaxID=2053627 RepID=UPI0026202100|nr:flagellar basal-body rod protein FlgG [Syntrophomonas sp.]MDD2510615.1 flagellar basal-body rod protein FlgG [Syntrophomonas sp.]MDD3879594.1 flagellar basal-body rod protein FlgG [Syntrophomonas sp.]MDD4626751.1 flagellar basal-body rod protein FlgG [Syntrophomonas sp.]